MGNIVEDRYEFDEVARAAYALDRMSPQEIARIISGDKREEVMRALAEACSIEQIKNADLASIKIKVLARLKIKYQAQRKDAAESYYGEFVPLKRPRHIPLLAIDFFQSVCEYGSQHFLPNDMGPAILKTRSGLLYKAQEDINELYVRLGALLKPEQISTSMNWITTKSDGIIDPPKHVSALMVLRI